MDMIGKYLCLEIFGVAALVLILFQSVNGTINKNKLIRKLICTQR